MSWRAARAASLEHNQLLHNPGLPVNTPKVTDFELAQALVFVGKNVVPRRWCDLEWDSLDFHLGFPHLEDPKHREVVPHFRASKERVIEL